MLTIDAQRTKNAKIMQKPAPISIKYVFISKKKIVNILDANKALVLF
jgi:hypothetical protein